MEILPTLNGIKGLNAEIRKWKKHKGKANYLRLVHKACLKFAVKPEKIAERFDFAILKRRYANQDEQELMQKAIVLWMILDKNSIFYRKLEERIGVALRRKGIYFDNGLFRTAVEEYLELLEPTILKSFDAKEQQTHVHIVCMYMLLPVELVRKWLWFCNVDFTGKEAFLRRLTPGQSLSLENHWDLFINQKIPMKDLPCFTEGAVNKVWKFLDLPYSFAPRMQEKNALAYNFCGFDIGFGLYPEKDSDQTTNKRQAMQFISTARRGESEVNMESGLYWYLYKTARSNEFYRKNKTVTLGPSICPGVWSTMFYWFYWLILSPVFFVWLTIGTLVGYTELPLVVVFCGIFSLPSAMLFLKAGKYFEQKYDKEYVKLLSRNIEQMAGLLTVTMVLFGIAYVSMLALIPFVLSILLLGTYCEKCNTHKFWEMPVVGKLLPCLFVLTLFWEPLKLLWESLEWLWSTVTLEAILNVLGYYFAMVFLFTAKLIFKFGIFLYDSKEVVGYIVLVFGGASLFVIGLYHLIEWSVRKFNQLIEKGDQEIHSLVWLMKSVSFSIAVMILGFTTGFFQNGTVNLSFISSLVQQGDNINGLSLVSLTIFWIVGLLLVMYSTIAVSQFNVEKAIGKRVVGKINKSIHTYGDDWEEFTINLNSLSPFFVSDIGMYQSRVNIVKQILGKIKESDNFKKILTLKALGEVSDDKGLGNIEAFIDFDCSLSQTDRYKDREWKLMAKLLLAGKLDNNSISAVSNASKASSHIELDRETFSFHDNALFKFIGRMVSKITSFFKWLYYGLLIKGVSDVWHFLSGLNKFCPKSPSSNRARI